MIKTAVGTSNNKNSYEAGRIIAEKIQKKLECNPDLVLLFSTLHYKNYDGGLKGILEGIYSVLPEETKLAGGIVPGFLNKDGCYARGVTAFALNYPNMNISIGYGKNTKRNPKKAAKQAVDMIKKNLKNDYENKIILSFISGGKNPDIPGLKNTNIIPSKVMATIMISMISFMQKVFQIGFGREKEVLENVIKELPDFNIIHSSSYSMPPYKEHYQFYKNKVLDEHSVFVAIESDLDFNVDFATGVNELENDLKITKINKKRTMIKSLDDDLPLHQYIKKNGWDFNTFQEFKWMYITAKNPFAYKKNNRVILRPPIMILGKYMGFLTDIESDNIFISNITAENMVNSVEEVFKINNPDFGFFTSCIARRDLLGVKVYHIQEKMKDYFNDKDFLLIYSSGEGIYKPDEDFYFLNETITSAIFKEKSN